MNQDSGTDRAVIRTLQIGKSWLPEQSGSGLDRMFYGLVRSLPEAGVSVRGLVAGTPKVANDSDGAVAAFSHDKSSLLTRYGGGRRAIRELVRTQSFDLAAVHFAVYAFPGQSYLRRLPRVIHFHGPWALESKVEGKSGLNVRAKLFVEQSVYRGAERFIVLS
ncbi:MAG: glycosyltransferase, partial [Rhodothermales bacterium]|nr:glycosyltransferase [Rhodothermales bacterium]